MSTKIQHRPRVSNVGNWQLPVWEVECPCGHVDRCATRAIAREEAAKHRAEAGA